MNTRLRSQMPHPAPSYRTPMPTAEVNHDGILHPALTSRRRRTINGLTEPMRRGRPLDRAPETEATRDVRPAAVPGYAPAVAPSDRARDDRLFADLLANAADAGHTRDRDELEAGDEFSDFSATEFEEEVEKGARTDEEAVVGEDDEEGRKSAD